MKRKRLLKTLFATVLMWMFCATGTWADTSVIQNGVGGWTKITSLPTTLSDYYFVFVDKDNDLMMSYGEGVNQTSSDTYKTMVYRTSEDPARNPLMLWTLENNDGGYSIKSAVEQTYYLQTENNAAWYCRAHDNGGGSASWYKWNITLSDGVYRLENGKYTGNYIGPWNGGAFSNGQEVAGNKTASGEVGYFYIYSILRSAVDLTGVTVATTSTPFNYTYKIKNPNAVKNTNGWTMGEGTGRNNGTGTFDGINGFFEPSQWGWNDFDIQMSQSVSGLPAGKYRLRAAIQSSSDCTVTLKANDNSSEAFQGSGTSNGTILQTGKETTEGNGIEGWKWRSLDFTDVTGTINIIFNSKTSATHNWANVDNVELYLLSPCLSALATTLLSSGESSADKWYSATIPSDGEYTICSSAATTIAYTQDGTQLAENITSSSATLAANGEQSVTINAGTLYLKSSVASTLEVVKNAEPVIADGIYFFKTDADKFWLRGDPYGSAVQVYDWGMPVKVTTNRSGITTLQFADASDWKIFSDGTGIFADNANHDNSTWSIIESGTKYIFKNAVNNHYMKVDGTRILSTATEGEATAFTLVTPADHQNVLTAYVNAQASTAATDAGLTASTPAELQTAADGINATTVIEGSTAATTAEKWQGGQWDARAVYSNTVNVTTPGLYKFTIQGFYRMTDNDATYALHTAQADCPPVYVFFGDAKTPIKSVMNESRSTAYEGNNCDYAQGNNHYPNQQASSLVAFQEGKYVNTVWAYISTAGEYTYGIQYLGWAGSHSEWTCYTTESVSLTLYSEDWWGSLQAALTTYAPYNDVVDATDYTTNYNTYAAYTPSTSQSDMLAAITYMQNNYANYQWANASIAHPVDVTEGIISGWECTSNDAWPGSGRTTATGTYYDGTNRTYFTQNHENGAARSQDVTIPEIGAYLLRTIVRPSADASFATISIGSESTTTRGIQTGSTNIGNGWAYNDIYFATTEANASKSISIALSNVNNSREADCGEMHLYYIGQSADFVKDGVHKYIGTFASAPALEVTDAVPVVDVTGATFTGTSAVTFSNPNGLVFVTSDGQTSAAKNEVIGTTCANLQLEKGHPFVNPKEFTATTAKYTMLSGELAGGSFATLIIPFSASTFAGTAYTLDQGVNLIDGNIYGTAVTTIAANSPVLVTASGNYTGSNVTVPVVASGTTYTNGELVGTYTAMAAPTNSYVLQNHTSGEGVAFYLVGSTKPTVNPFRAYIKAQGSNVKALTVLFSDADGIESLTSSPSPVGEGSIYSLSGQRLSKPQRGVNIINGKKVIVK